MSFKVKSWNLWRQVDLSGELAGGGEGSRTFAIPWAGKILVLAFDPVSGDPVCAWYDPATDTLTEPVAAGIPYWSLYRASQGWAPTQYRHWGSRFTYGHPGRIGSYFGDEYLWCFDAAGTFLNPAMRLPQMDGCQPASRIGFDGTNPCVLSWQWDNDAGTEHICKTTPYGTSILATAPQSGDDFWFYIASGSARYDMMALYGGYYHWAYDSGVYAIYTAPPRDSTKDNYLALGSAFGGNPYPSPDGLSAFIQNTVGGDTYWSRITDPLTEEDPPWATVWNWRAERFGAQTDENDVDGYVHGCTIDGPLDSGLTATEGGWLIGTDADQWINGLAFNVWVLDPGQPGGRAGRGSRPYNGALGWMGEYQLGSDLSLRHVLPFPDSRNPSGSGTMPPQERSDGYLVGSKEVFQAQGSGYSYVREVKVDLSAYSHGGDWWFPGEDPGEFYPGFWQLFAGVGPTVIGYMPDNDWGMLNPLGQACDRFLGLPDENLKTALTHVCKNSYVISGTTFAQRLSTAGIGNVRTMLHSGLDGSKFAFVTSGTFLGSKPEYKAVIGTVAGRTWTTVKQFDDGDRPGLGETDWTIWSVVPIPRCTGLPQGGWLVGATLYFAPWEDGEWESEPGARDATFLDTGNGWVPALPGWRGPLNDDDHHPIYLTGYDEWTFGRSRYGPDALLVYDHAGNFRTHLNSLGVHAPDGREIIVTGESNPKVVFRIYRHGTYSDFAEGYGQYHALGTNEEIQAPLYVCYDLLDHGVVQPGLGMFRGFVDMYEVGGYAAKDAEWRWSVPDTIYDWQYPQTFWKPPSSAYVRSGRGSGGVTPLTPGPGSVKTGVKGVGLH